MYRRHTNTLRPPPTRRVFRQILRKMRRAFSYPLAGECGVRGFVESVGGKEGKL